MSFIRTNAAELGRLRIRVARYPRRKCLIKRLNRLFTHFNLQKGTQSWNKAA